MDLLFLIDPSQGHSSQPNVFSFFFPVLPGYVEIILAALAI